MADLILLRTTAIQQSEREIYPQYLPLAATDALTNDFHVTEVVFTNVTASPVTVTVLDKQAIPMALFSGTTVPANSVLVAQFKGRLMPSGINWQASVASAVVVSVRGY